MSEYAFRTHLALIAAAMSLCLIASCSRKETKKPSAASTAPQAKSPAAPSAASSAHHERLEGAPLTEEQVRKLLDSWQSAQNTGNFDAYSTLYAARFTGIKRSGTFTAQYARSAWLADRKTMFAKPMKVNIKDVDVGVSPQSARVLMTQSWSSGTYSDVGPKQMVIVPSKDGPRIAREEMLSSTIVGRSESLPPASNFRLADDEGVIVSTAIKEEWAEGAARGEGTTVAYRSVKTNALPPELLAVRGRNLRLMGASGQLCESSIVRLVLRAKIVPHFGMLAEWRGESDTKKPSNAEIAKQVWELSQNDGRVLIGELATPCKGALWAMETTEAAPAVVAPEPAPAELGAAALNAFRALPRHKELQRESLAQQESKAHPDKLWDEVAGARAIWIVRPKTGPALILVSVSVDQGCASFSAALSALFQVKQETKPELELKGLFEPESLGQLRPRAAFDLEADGTFDLLLGPDGPSEQRSLLRATRSGYQRQVLTQVPYLDCPC